MFDQLNKDADDDKDDNQFDATMKDSGVGSFLH